MPAVSTVVPPEATASTSATGTSGSPVPTADQDPLAARANTPTSVPAYSTAGMRGSSTTSLTGASGGPAEMSCHAEAPEPPLVVLKTWAPASTFRRSDLHWKGLLLKHPWSGGCHSKVQNAIPRPLRPGDLRFLARPLQFPRVGVDLGGGHIGVAERDAARAEAVRREQDLVAAHTAAQQATERDAAAQARAERAEQQVDQLLAALAAGGTPEPDRPDTAPDNGPTRPDRQERTCPLRHRPGPSCDSRPP